MSLEFSQKDANTIAHLCVSWDPAQLRQWVAETNQDLAVTLYNEGVTGSMFPHLIYNGLLSSLCVTEDVAADIRNRLLRLIAEAEKASVKNVI